MPKKNFHFYLEKAQGKENSVIEKINEILDFRKGIKDSNIVKESFTFLHYPEGSEFNPTTYTNDENAMSATNVSDLFELKKMIIEQNLYSENNSITYNIEYLENDAMINKVFSTEESSSEREWGDEYEKKITSSTETKKQDEFSQEYEKQFSSFSTSEIKK
jgi:hypothetical protein